MLTNWFRRLRLRLARKLVGGNIAGLLPKPRMHAIGRVVNPGDPDWVPSPKFVPPADFTMPPGWTWDREFGWRRVVERMNSDAV